MNQNSPKRSNKMALLLWVLGILIIIPLISKLTAQAQAQYSGLGYAYEHVNFSGFALPINVDFQNFYGDYDNNISSLCAPPDIDMIAYDGLNRTDSSLTIPAGECIPDLSGEPFPGGGNWNDRISSIELKFHTTIQFSPSKTDPDQGFLLYVNRMVDGQIVPYSGALDYDLVTCELTLANCRYTPTTSGQYTATNGVVTGPGTVLRSYLPFVVSGGTWQYAAPHGVLRVPDNSQPSSGIHLFRFKPSGTSDSQYSNFDVLAVTDMDLINLDVTYTADQISLPTRGSYMIFSDTDSNHNFVGYTRIDIETDSTCVIPGGGSGYIMRFTKTRQRAYWNAGDNSFLRWCVTQVTDPNPPYHTYLVASGQAVYRTAVNVDLPTLAADNIKVSYSSNGMQDQGTQGLLGGYPTDQISAEPILKDADMVAHYAILPPGRFVPSGLSTNAPINIVEFAFGHPLHGPTNAQGLDTWHAEAYAPPTSTDALRMRYVETGAVISPVAQQKWSVTEDWVWQLNGLVSEITQWADVDPLCWTGTYHCENGSPKVQAELIDWYIPDANPLSVLYKNVQTGEVSTLIQIPNGGAYDLLVQKSDGSPYSGFLEYQINNGLPSLWSDKDGRPIYVSNGHVIVGPEAYGDVSDWQIAVQWRPYLVNSSLNSLYPVSTPIANASGAAWSDWVTLIIGTP